MHAWFSMRSGDEWVPVPRELIPRGSGELIRSVGVPVLTLDRVRGPRPLIVEAT